MFTFLEIYGLGFSTTEKDFGVIVDQMLNMIQ